MASNADGDGPDSEEVSAIPGLVAPAYLHAVGGTGTVDLYWSAPSGGEAPTGYDIHRSATSPVDTGGASYASVGSATTTYTDSGVAEGVTQYYKVVATNADGSGPDSGQVGARPITAATWTEVTANAGWTIADFATVEYNGKIWIFGGNDYSSPFTDDVWSSTDGVTWSFETNTPGWSPRSLSKVVVFQEKLWLTGGIPAADSGSSEVWSSSDGINWTLENSTPGWSPRGAHTSLVYDGKIWVIGGCTTGVNRFSDIWNSTDGVTWA